MANPTFHEGLEGEKLVDYAIDELEPNEIPLKDIEITFLQRSSLCLIVRFSRTEFDNFKKVLDLLSLKQVAYGYETPSVGSDDVLRWNVEKGKLESEKVHFDCGVAIDIQINGNIIILDFCDETLRLTQDFTFKQWAKFKKKILCFPLGEMKR